MKRALLAVAVATLAAAGCSGSPSPAPSEPPSSSAAAPTPAAPTSAASTSAAPTPGGSITPASSCLSGSYRLVRFVGAGANTYGTGQGGDVTVAFTDGKYVMKGAGQEPVTVTLAGQSAPLTVDGTIEGAYSGTGEQASFTRGKTSGSATVKAGGQTRTLPMSQIANVLAPSGDGKLACTSDQLSITLKAVRLELEH